MRAAGQSGRDDDGAGDGSAEAAADGGSERRHVDPRIGAISGRPPRRRAGPEPEITASGVDEALIEGGAVMKVLPPG